MVLILSLTSFVCSIFFYVECRHVQFLYSSRGIFILALVTFFFCKALYVCVSGICRNFGD